MMKASPEARARVIRARELARIQREAVVVRCWCDWAQDDGRSHDAHIEAYHYPDHEPAPEWNLPEPVARPKRKLSRPRVGPRMRELRDIVSACPGISKSDALRLAGLPTHGMGSGRELNRAIMAGLVIVEYQNARRTHLFASDRDRRWWHLRAALLAPGTPDERIAQIRAEISALDAERAATWTEAS